MSHIKSTKNISILNPANAESENLPLARFQTTKYLSTPDIASYPVAELDNLLGVYSFLLRVQGYGGPLFRAYNGVEELDFRDYSNIGAFFEAGDGTQVIVKWYNQKSDSHHYMQSSYSLCPRLILDSSQLIGPLFIQKNSGNENAYLYFDENPTILKTINLVARRETGTESWAGIAQQKNSEALGQRFNSAATSYDTYDFANSASNIYVNNVNTAATTINEWHNGYFKSASAKTWNGSTILVNGSFKTGRRFVGSMRELLLFSEYIDRDAVAENVNAIYQIY